jgi:hypothetical protein
MMNPSRHQLPQKVSPDRQRGRAVTCKLEQARFEMCPVPLPGHDGGDPKKSAEHEEGEDYRRPLPPRAEEVPADVDFPKPQVAQLVVAKYGIKLTTYKARLRLALRRFDRQDDYHALYRSLGGDPQSLGHWRLDAEFGRQRLDGVNPMHIRRLRDDARTPVWEAAARVLSQTSPKHDIAALFKAGRLYVTDYAVLAHPTVQREVRKAAGRGKLPVRLAAPTCVLWEDDAGQLLPLAIQLKPARVAENNPVITPLHKPGDWQMARAHVSAADGHLHEGYYHLLETHLVNEAVALCMYRRLHPDHPVRQLLTPHYQGTLAINKQARGHLLSTVGKGGPIQRAMAAGVVGTLNAAALLYRDWRFPERSFKADIAARGVEDLRNYHYRDDARSIDASLRWFVDAFLRLWYRADRDVVEDYELQHFVCEVGAPRGAAIPGFPLPAKRDRLCDVCGSNGPCAAGGAPRIDNTAALVDLIADLIFRGGPQHAAVNNGQFDTYGEVANGPGRLYGELPEEIRLDEEHTSEAAFWRRLPDPQTAVQQMAMVWVLSLPTRRSILQTGEFPDFDPALSFEAVEAIASLRRKLQTISYTIQERNTELAIPYRYLDPQNVSLSTDI